MATEELLAEISGRVALSPLERAEFHAKLAERHLREAEELLARGEHIQASEKAWAAYIVRAVAAKAGRELRCRGDLRRYVNKIARGNAELRRLRHIASAHFHEGWMPSGDVRYAVQDVRKFVERMRRMLA